MKAIALATALTLAAAPSVVAQGADTQPLTIHVTDSARKETSKTGRLMAALSDGDVRSSVKDVESALQPYSTWLRVGPSDSELWYVVQSRSRREERSGNTFNHVYRVVGSLDFPDRSERIEVETRLAEDKRNDYEAFKNLGNEMAGRLAGLVQRELDRIRPNRPQPGFDWKVRTRMLVIPDGLEVVNVHEGSPAERAGLRPKDRIKSIDGEKDTGKMERLMLGLWTSPPATRNFEIERDKKRSTYPVAFSARPQWAQAAPPPAAKAAPAPAKGLAPSAPQAPSGSSGGDFEIKPGMSESEVTKGLGAPEKRVKFGAKTIWTYAGFSVTFENGKVTEVK